VASAKNKTHRRRIRRGGLLALRFLNAYRAIPPHCGALLQLQQERATIISLWFTGLKVSYSGAVESQFAGRLGGGVIPSDAPKGVEAIIAAVPFLDGGLFSVLTPS
jgi:hypothetical protein